MRSAINWATTLALKGTAPRWIRRLPLVLLCRVIEARYHLTGRI
jgi:hypothetical protein